jgi:cyclic pyranopterin phosphate synthase
MSKTIPITSLDDLKSSFTTLPIIPKELKAPVGLLQDAHGRLLHDLRISVTDRCNFRCSYCMPKEIFTKQYNYLGQSELLSFEEIIRLAGIFIGHGVEKIRLTGGEPLLRKGIEDLVSMLSVMKTPSGKPIDLTLTTNGSLLQKKAKALFDAGLSRVTVSLDGINDAVFRQMNDVDFPVQDVLDSIETASIVGFKNIKVNMVVKKGVNEHEILPMVEHFRNTGVILRFIEYMDVGNTNGWQMSEVVPSQSVIDLINEKYPIVPVEQGYSGEVAQKWQFVDGSGEIGVISSVTQAFCSSCTRARISMEGKLFLCLFANTGFDLKQLLRTNVSDLEISNAIANIWQGRQDRYSELRGKIHAGEISHAKVEMSYIGG